MTRTPFIVILFLVLSFTAAHTLQAQDAAPPVYLDWIPADFDGFARISTDDTDGTLRRLNFGLFIAASLQPLRFPADLTAPTLDDYFPLDMLDLESASFQANIAPWLGDEIVIAYRGMNADFQADEALMILPTYDAFTSAFVMRGAIEGQDLLQRQPYRGITIYSGDRTAIAFTPQAVLIAPEAILIAAIDRMHGEGDALTANDDYGRILARLPADAPLTAYLSGAAARGLMPMFFAGNGGAALAALGGALGESEIAALLNGDVNAFGVTFIANPDMLTEARARLIVALDDDSAPPAVLDPAVFDFIPRSAMIVHSGGDGAAAGVDALSALPLYAFAPDAFRAFGVPQNAGENLPVPSAEQISAVIDRFNAALDSAVNLDLRRDLLARLNGSYAIAIIPRPNNPIPVWNASVEVLLVARVDQPDQTVDALLTLIETFSDERFARQRIDGNAIYTLTAPESEAPLLKIGTVDDWLIVGTGGALDAALAAHGGDNRLIAQPRWTALTAERVPNIYIDLNSYLNTFFPPEGGTTQTGFTQMGLYWQQVEGGLFEIEAVVRLP